MKSLFLSVLLVPAFLGACSSAPPSVPSDSPLAGVSVGDGADAVCSALGPPRSHAKGLWEGVSFDTSYDVWYYRGVGRVLFDRAGRVCRTEHDPQEDGAP